MEEHSASKETKPKAREMEVEIVEEDILLAVEAAEASFHEPNFSQEDTNEKMQIDPPIKVQQPAEKSGTEKANPKHPPKSVKEKVEEEESSSSEDEDPPSGQVVQRNQLLL